MSDAPIDWAKLKSLRERFLSESVTDSVANDYWEDRATLEAYDASFAARIGWKWDAVLQELKASGWQPPEGAALLDWGCGTAVAARRFVATFGESSVREIFLSDRSTAAVRFGQEKLAGAQAWPNDSAPDGFILLLSHVWGELDPRAKKRLLRLAAKAAAILWVEPGTPTLSRELIAIREKLKDEFTPRFPCPHSERCGMLAKENARHWCHHFALPPPKVFTDGFWARFSRELGIDLRSLPVSYLVLTKTKRKNPEEDHRVIGRPRVYKGYVQALVCNREGVTDKKIRTRDEPALAERLETGGFSIVF